MSILREALFRRACIHVSKRASTLRGFCPEPCYRRWTSTSTSWQAFLFKPVRSALVPVNYKQENPNVTLFTICLRGIASEDSTLARFGRTSHFNYQCTTE